MNNSPYQHWFVEKFGNEGTSFGLAIKSKLHDERSQYQHIEIYDTHTFGHLMVIDGCVMLSQRDNFLYHEMMAHPAIFSHPNPKKVVIIGGGDCGTLKEVLKHPEIVAAWQIEIDERVTRLAESYFPELCTSNHDPRAHFHFGDGIQWIKEQPENSIDLIIVDSTDPVGPAAGLFTTDFFDACLKALSHEGILVQQSESPLLHSATIIKSLHTNMKKVGFRSIVTLPFPQPVYPTGWWSCTMASKDSDCQQFRSADSQNKQFQCEYYNHAIHLGALAQPEFLRRALSAS